LLLPGHKSINLDYLVASYWTPNLEDWLKKCNAYSILSFSKQFSLSKGDQCALDYINPQEAQYVSPEINKNGKRPYRCFNLFPFELLKGTFDRKEEYLDYKPWRYILDHIPKCERLTPEFPLHASAFCLVNLKKRITLKWFTHESLSESLGPIDNYHWEYGNFNPKDSDWPGWSSKVARIDPYGGETDPAIHKVKYLKWELLQIDGDGNTKVKFTDDNGSVFVSAVRVKGVNFLTARGYGRSYYQDPQWEGTDSEISCFTVMTCHQFISDSERFIPEFNSETVSECLIVSQIPPELQKFFNKIGWNYEPARFSLYNDIWCPALVNGLFSVDNLHDRERSPLCKQFSFKSSGHPGSRFCTVGSYSISGMRNWKSAVGASACW